MQLPSALLFATLSLTGQADSPRPLPGEMNNAVLTSGHPSVGFFLNGDSVCTATLIGCQTVLTAAHCLCGEEPCSPPAEERYVYFPNIGVLPVDDVAIHPDWAPALGLGRHDVALLHLAVPAAGIQPALLATSKPPVGIPALLVGFGSNPASPSGIKRQGLVQLAACSDGNPGGLCYNFVPPLGPAGEDSTACPGDSGGPMFVSSGGSLLVAGVTSGGIGPGSHDCTAPLQGIYSDVSTDLAWILALAGGDLGQASCGGLPNAGSSQAPYAGASGRLDGSHTSAPLTMEIPAGTHLLAVLLNGQTDADFNLYVKRGSPASPASFDCKSEIAGLTLESCLIENPAPGTWHYTVTRAAGDGDFQLTATTYKAAVNSGPCVRDATTACLQNGRFEVRIGWQNPQGSGAASVMSFGGQRAETAETAFYSFQTAANFEMGVKVLNACVPILGNKFWVFVSGLTDQGWTVTVRDTQTGAVRTYGNPVGKLSSTFADTAAFSCL